MQPLKPFQGVPYDSDMFTFLPALASRDVLVESPRKRKSMASDSQSTTPAPTMGYAPLENPSPKEKAGDLRGTELQCSVSASSPRDSSTFRNHSDSAKVGYRNDSGALWHLNERNFYESRSHGHEFSSFIGQSHSSNYNHLVASVRSSAGMTYKSPTWSPSVTEDFNRHRTRDSNTHVGGKENGYHFPESLNYGTQMPTLMKVEGSNYNVSVLEEPQNSHPKFPKPGAYILGSDNGSCHEHSDKVETFSKTKGFGNSSSFVRVDCSKMLANNVGTSILDLGKTNRILQQALRILSASSSTSMIVNQDGSSQGSEGDTSKIKSMSNPQTQNLSQSSTDDILSKGSEACLNLHKSIISGDKDSANVDDGPKSENGGSPLVEKLWDGTLRLSSSVSVPAVAFFKSGERMQDFCWSGAVEVKGKVRMEAFEKYVQDLPRSRTRGLMSLRYKCGPYVLKMQSLFGYVNIGEGSSAESLRKMKEVARKYREGKRVGFAQLNRGLDMYICPHSDSVITVLAKYGFFKGMTAVTEKTDPLTGCVVWRKNSSSVPATETTLMNPPDSGASLCKQSDENSEKIQSEIDQTEQSLVPENKMASVVGKNNQVSELNSNVETVKSNSSVPPVLIQSVMLSDGEDLPEYDFGAAVSQTSKSKSSANLPVSLTPEQEKRRGSHVHQHIVGQMRSENSTVSRTLPDPHFQELPQNMKHQSGAHNPSMQPQQENQRGLAPENMGHQTDAPIPSWSIEEKKPANGCTSTMKPKNLFDDDDDDDMQEWSPPEFKKMGLDVNQKPNPGPGPGPGPSMVPRFSFTDLATGRQLPPPPPLPPQPPLPPGPPPLSTQGRSDKNYPSVPHFPNQAVNSLMHENPGTNKTSINYSSPAPSPQMQFQAIHHPQPVHLPPPPPPRPSTPSPPLNRPHFSYNDHSAPQFSTPSANNFMNNRPVAPSSHVQFPDQRYLPAPLPLPPMPDKITANNFMHRNPADIQTQMQFQNNNRLSAPLTRPQADKREPNGLGNDVPPFPTQMQFQNNNYPSSPAARSQADKHEPNGPESEVTPFPTQMQFHDINYSYAPPGRAHADKREPNGSGNEVLPFPPNFTPNPGVRPQFHRSGMNNHAPQWRGSRP